MDSHLEFEDKNPHRVFLGVLSVATILQEAFRKIFVKRATQNRIHSFLILGGYAASFISSFELYFYLYPHIS